MVWLYYFAPDWAWSPNRESLGDKLHNQQYDLADGN